MLASEQGKEAFEGTSDASLRLFSTHRMLQVEILTYPFRPNDSIAEVLAVLKQNLTAGEGNQELSFDPIHDVAVGERGGVFRFARPSTGEEGYELFFIRRNTAVRLTSVGQPGAMTEEGLLRLATVVDERMRQAP